MSTWRAFGRNIIKSVMGKKEEKLVSAAAAAAVPAAAEDNKQNQISTKRDGYNTWSKKKLIRRINELEELAKKNNAGISTPDGSQITESKVKPKQKQFDFSKYSTRFVALRFSYLGWNYNGLAIQNHETALPTVEEEIIKALYQCRLVPSLEPKDFNFSRCGRTDKGVSAMNQVISLNVRSNLKSKEEQLDPANDEKEIDYVRILNKLVPRDIRFKAVCLRPPANFDARFSCQYRHYKYMFHKKDLDIELMQQAARKYEGGHDFRNFCKIDGSKQIKNFNRTILSSSIISYDDEFCVFDLKGTAFLWHQVRCMIAVLFLIGSRLEKAEIIDYLFDVANNPNKPVYDMAHDIPLVLYDCKFPDSIEWQVGADSKSSEVYPMWLDYRLKSNINGLVNGDLLSDQVSGVVKTEQQQQQQQQQQHHHHHNNSQQRIVINIGDGKGKPIKEYVKLQDRKKMDSVEEQNEKFLNKKRRLK